MINLSVTNANLLVSNLSILKGQPTARLIADEAAASGSLAVSNISGFTAGDFYVLIGTFGDSSAEIVKMHASTVPTGSTITLATNTVKDHYSDSVVTQLDFNQVEFSRATTLAGSKSVLGTQDINADRLDSLYKDLTNSTGFAFARFKNEDSGAFSSYSTGVNYTGNDNTSVEKIVEKACMDSSVEVGGQYSTETMLLNDANDAQDAFTNDDWTFELVKNDTSLTATEYENTYALSGLTYELKYPGNSQGIKAVKFSNAPLQLIDNNEMDELYKSVHRTAVATQIEINDTSIVLDNTADFDSSGTVYIDGLAIPYTTNTKSTNTLSGIASGVITAQILVDAIVWQNINPGLPTKYTISVDNEIVLDRPVLDDYDGYAIKVEYLKKLSRFTDFTSTTEIPFTDFMSKFIEAKIEKRKRNFDNYRDIMKDFDKDKSDSLKKYKLPILDGNIYYEFFDQPVD